LRCGLKEVEGGALDEEAEAPENLLAFGQRFLRAFRRRVRPFGVFLRTEWNRTRTEQEQKKRGRLPFGLMSGVRPWIRFVRLSRAY
jgi:hypothetical protein